MTEKLLEAPAPVLELSAPEPELALPSGLESALPARPDYIDKPNNYLETSISYFLDRIQTIGDSFMPEDVADKLFLESEVTRVQAILDLRTKQH